MRVLELKPELVFEECLKVNAELQRELVFAKVAIAQLVEQIAALTAEDGGDGE